MKNKKQFNYRFYIACLATIFWLPMQAFATAKVAVYVQAPFEVSNGKMDLDDIESYNTEPVYSHSFVIPYASLEQKVIGEINKSTTPKAGNVNCEPLGSGLLDPLCPDVDYNISFANELHFTQRGQPQLQAFGNASENGVDVRLEGVQANLKTTITVSTSLLPDPVIIPVDLYFGIHARSKAYLWPSLNVVEPHANVTLDQSFIDVNGLHQPFTIAGAVAGGALVLPTGEPITTAIGAIIGAVVGNEAANIADQRIKDEISKFVANKVVEVNSMLPGMIEGYIRPAETQANNFKDRLFNTPIPKLGKTISDLESEWGVTVDVRSVVKDNQLNVVATTRFAAQPDGGTLYGKVKFPKTACHYGVVTGFQVKILKCDKLVAANEDLKNYVGQSCNTVFSDQDIQSFNYLGESPEKLLNSGDPNNDLPSWVQQGQVALTGMLEDHDDHYACGFRVSNLPATAISEVKLGDAIRGKVEDRRFHSERSLLFPLGQDSILLDDELNLYSSMSVILGWGGPKSPTDCPSSIVGFELLAPAVSDTKFDPENCPVCGVELLFDHYGQEVVNQLNLTNSEVTYVAPASINELNPQPLPPKENELVIENSQHETPVIDNQAVINDLTEELNFLSP